MFTQGTISFAGKGRWHINAQGDACTAICASLVEAVRYAPVHYPFVETWLVNLGGQLDAVLMGPTEMTTAELIALGAQYA